MGPGIALACAMWVMTMLSLALVGLRLYTRVRLVRFVGAEDHLYAWTGIFLLVFTCAIQVAVHFGLGTSFWSLSLQSSSDAIFWTYVANTFAITGNAMAKLSMGLFLLRVVQLPWHKWALWILVAITAGTSAALTVMLWNQTTPVKASWDPLRTPGVWHVQIQPLSVGLGVWSSACDFFFAVFPWLFIWSLRMPRREKIMLASSMSLGVIAGVCGIIRTVVLARLNVLNYTLNFVSYFAWAGAEIAVAMVCLGIPTLRPLYLRHRGISVAHTHPSHNNNDDVLAHFTMCEQEPEPARLENKPPVDIEAGSPEAGSPEAGSPQTAESAGSAGSTRSNDSTKNAAESILSELSTIDAAPAALPTRPPNVYTSRGKDSVDEILGLYGQNYGRITTRNETLTEHTAGANWPLKT